jgi:signal transduction histidine kinase
MTELLDKILILGRAEAGKLICQAKAIALSDFCQELVDELQISIGQQYQLRFSCSGSPPTTARMDENLLRHIFGNLLSNAMKYSPPNSVVQFTLDYQDNQAIFSVQDSGIGIPPDDQARLFESFYRATNVGTISGTGLGLAIVKNCIEAHEGQIAVSSVVGEGTTFTVTLPLQPSTDTQTTLDTD